VLTVEALGFLLRLPVGFLELGHRLWSSSKSGQPSACLAR
jgi:hypothetical protein